MSAPDGWTLSDDELAVAEDAAVLEAREEPARPVAFVTDQLDPRTPGEIIEQDLAFPEGGTLPAEVSALVGDVEEVEIDGEEAGSVALETAKPNPDGTTEGAPGWTRRYITAHPVGQLPVVFVLVAPDDQWEAAESLLDAVPGFSTVKGVPIPESKDASAEGGGADEQGDRDGRRR